MYKYYALQDAGTLDNNLDVNVMTLNFNEFTKFGHMTSIVPKIISANDLVIIFRLITKEKMKGE